ncbi:hypothetical protein LTR37_007595 [Vermiconidia calcicola]|uniref:Uncharacterized protein n=1 Tax=Vermiconidia calcicola TaxID=1690605 RepID=A0ACC3ND77_9PEZI|nr:hypothetical protein LTR37_007595 [Vermiconidia calcicola]
MSDQALFDRIHRHHEATVDPGTPTLSLASDGSSREQYSEPSSPLIGPWSFPSAAERAAQPRPHHFDSVSVSPKCTYATYDDAARTISDGGCIHGWDRRRHYGDSLLRNCRMLLVPPTVLATCDVATDLFSHASIPGLSGGSTPFSTETALPSNVAELSTPELVRLAKRLTGEIHRIASELERRQPADDDDYFDDGELATCSSCLRGGGGDTSPAFSASVSPLMLDAGSGGEGTAEKNSGSSCITSANVPLPPSPDGASTFEQASESPHDFLELIQGTERPVLGSTTSEPWRIDQQQREDAADFFYRKAVQEGYDHAWLMSREYLTCKKDSKIPALLEQVAAERARYLQEQEDYYFALSLEQAERRRVDEQMERLWSNTDVQKALHRTIHGGNGYDGDDELKFKCNDLESSDTEDNVIPGEAEESKSDQDPTEPSLEFVNGSPSEYAGVQLPMDT